LIRGNASEIIALAGLTGKGRGVDSGDSTDRALDAARQLARGSGGAVLVTGPIDYSTDGSAVIACSNGDALMTRVTGVGCAQGAIAAAFVAVSDTPLQAATATAVLMGIAGEFAASVSRRPGSFQIALLDALDAIDGAAVRSHGRIGAKIS
jgi:hydroxyethylthiazole kinase